MGWGQIPSEARAAEEARAEAIALAESKPMSPFERKLISVLENIRDNLGASLPEPLPGDSLPEAHVLVRHADGSVQDFGPGVYLSTTDPNEPLGPLLDSAPAVLARSIAAGGLALSNAFPTFRDDLTAAGFEKFAEVAIEAALHEAARDRRDEAARIADTDIAPDWPDMSAYRGSEAEAGDDEPPGPSPASPRSTTLTGGVWPDGDLGDNTD